MTHPAFSPGTVDPRDLDARTVGRGPLLKRLTDRIISSAQDGSRPHTLLVAPRGAGKTHTLQVALHRALKQRKAAKATLLLELSEDALAIGSYPDLLVELLRTLGPDVHERARQLRGDALELEREILDLAAGRMVLVAIENADRIFDAIGEAGQGSFRAWVETSTAVLVFATSPALFPAVSSRTHPWYGSFIIEELPDLTDADVAELLTQHARDRELVSYVGTSEGRHKIDDVAQIVGWSPRVWQIIADTVDKTGLQEVRPAADAALEQLTPHYQQVLWQLPAGEQRLIVELARADGGRTVTDLAAAVGISNQSASAALGRLTTGGWVHPRKADSGDRRATWYDLSDPLLRNYLHYRERRQR
ncbi:MarR family transcriptional regulator [Mycolicibacterium mucogenicum]|uniref:MarR family transcriptional regulator n=1 Tax=Mycolicibacterium mucogenicum TaxID=56689 RepID=A0A1A0LXQ5_MYCMU|nr:MarR family transcriptional regulator [Mycolicibacterium mucogenicum]OBA77887.1 MarR family transcriptional regulator [Mycolicibacterium mucogenicum]